MLYDLLYVVYQPVNTSLRYVFTLEVAPLLQGLRVVVLVSNL
jgi:hypothetical protein